MELTGSLTEQRFRSSLVKLQYFLIDHKRHDDIVAAVSGITGAKPEIFALESFPDNDDDYFVLLVNSSRIIELEASRTDDAPIMVESSTDITDFRRKLSMINQIMLAVALDMTGQI